MGFTTSIDVSVTMAGFRKGRSSVDNVVALVTHVDDQKFRGKLTTVIFPVVEGPFDNIKHSSVLQGLKAVGDSGRFYASIADYLHNQSG